MKLLIASNNQGKIQEFATLLQGQKAELCKLADFNLDSPPETADTFEGNALIKAQHGALATGLITISDDSGFEVAALDNAPSVYSARWANGNYPKAFQKIQALLGKNWHNHAEATFQCVLCLYFPSKEYKFFTGSCEGKVTFPARGNNGFGYDSIFIPKGDTKTFAEMLPAEKAKYSHRAKALAKLQTYFQQNPLVP